MDADFDPEPLAIAMMTLRLRTPDGQWLSDEDQILFDEFWAQATAQPSGDEELLLSMMNLCWYALINLETMSGESTTAWLARIAADVRGVE
jgi:hypothetical protein